LVVCTETYYRRFRGREEPGKGKGVDWEGNLITLAIYQAKSSTKKLVPVLFDRQDESFIPEPLRGHTRYLLNSEESYDKLYAFLVGKAGVTPGELGSLKTLVRNPVEPCERGQWTKGSTSVFRMNDLHRVADGLTLQKRNFYCAAQPHRIVRFDDAYEIDSAGIIAGDDRPSVSGNRATPHGTLSSENGDSFLALNVPKPQRVVLGTRDDKASVGRHRHGVDLIGMAFEFADRLAALQVPEPQRSVL
jgi:hypothetical protein